VVNFTPRPLYPQGKSPPFPLDRKLGEPPEPVWTTWRKNSWLYQDSNSNLSAVQPIASCYTHYAIPSTIDNWRSRCKGQISGPPRIHTCSLSSFICAHALTEGKDDTPKHPLQWTWYSLSFSTCPQRWQWEMYRPTTGRWSLHEISSNNITVTTYFLHNMIHMEIRQSPDGFAKNEIRHMLTNARHKILKMWEAVDILCRP
jgi:hypothetical protein